MAQVSQAYHHCVKALELHAPNLWKAENVLYVGANRHAMPGLVAEMKAHGAKVHLLEAWGENVAHYQEKDPDIFETVMLDDVRDLGAPAPPFDAVVWWHGPEHLPADEWPGVLAKLEQIAPLVILGCPWGISEQGEEGGNPYEAHQSTIYPADLEACGYQVVAIGGGPDVNGYLVAWKGDSGEGEPWYYAKLADSPTFWLIRDGTRQALRSPAEMYKVGLLPVVVMGEDELGAIPVKAERLPHWEGAG